MAVEGKRSFCSVCSVAELESEVNNPEVDKQVTANTDKRAGGFQLYPPCRRWQRVSRLKVISTPLLIFLICKMKELNLRISKVFSNTLHFLYFYKKSCGKEETPLHRVQKGPSVSMGLYFPHKILMPNKCQIILSVLKLFI